MPNISIIVCTFNDSRFLPACIKSCVNHEVDKELIIVDDCSSIPMTKDAIDAIADFSSKFPTKVIKHDENQGLSAARNTGIQASSSEWVIPLDADDWFYENSLRTLWEHRADVDVVTGNCTDSGQVYAPAVSRGHLSKEIFIRENPVICSSLMTKEIWGKAGRYTVRKGPHYEDWNLWAKCFAKGARFKHIPFNVYNHTSRADSMLRILHTNRDMYARLATEGVF